MKYTHFKRVILFTVVFLLWITVILGDQPKLLSLRFASNVLNFQHHRYEISQHSPTRGLIKSKLRKLHCKCGKPRVCLTTDQSNMTTRSTTSIRKRSSLNLALITRHPSYVDPSQLVLQMSVEFRCSGQGSLPYGLVMGNL